MRLFAVVPILAVSLAVSAVAQQVSEQDAWQAGQSVLDAWNNASQQKDAARLAALYTEDAVHVTPHGLISGRTAFEKENAEIFKVYTPELSKIEHASMIGNGVMLRAGTWGGTYNGPDGPVHLTGYWSDTDVRDGNMWKIRLETYNMILPLPETKK